MNHTLPLLTAMARQVLLLIDWDNIFYGLSNRFGIEEIQIEKHIKKLVDWTKEQVGELLGGYGFVFAPEHLSHFHQQICVNNGLKLIICPKRHLLEPRVNPKTGETTNIEDTVDETIIWFAETMFCHPNFKFICLATGDRDYIPLLKQAEKHGIKRALVIPSLNSVSNKKELIRLTDRHPTTLKRMVLRLDK